MRLVLLFLEPTGEIKGLGYKLETRLFSQQAQSLSISHDTATSSQERKATDFVIDPATGYVLLSQEPTLIPVEWVDMPQK
ncbi:MAG: hypothetical protein RMK19_09325 [Bacteroidia bacterium]|nr:hypothetical protein [Bacteroidia bacterium]